MKLDQDDIEAIARRVAELVRPDPERTARYLTVGQLAEQFGVSTEWVYEHKAAYISLMLLACRGDIEWVMAQVGHADSETTMRIYSQLLKRQKRDGYDAMVDEARAHLCVAAGAAERPPHDGLETSDPTFDGTANGTAGSNRAGDSSMVEPTVDEKPC